MVAELKYYNYVSFYRGIPVYVGKGTGDRWKHTLYGQSSSEMLNDFFFRKRYLNDMPLDTYIVKRFKTDADALKGEKRLIDKYKPYCNKCSGRYHESDYEFKEKLEKLCEEKGYSKPEILESKFDFRFLFTPLGLWCTGVDLDKNSPFEYAERGYHIRIKRELFRYFPEFFLHFMTHDSETSGDNLTAFHTKPVYINKYEICKFDVFKNHKYGLDWELEAITGKSFDFAEDFGFIFKDFNIDRYFYHHSLKEDHVLRFKKYLADKEIKDRKEMMKESSENKTFGKLSVKSCFGSNDIRIKVTEKVLLKLEDSGFNITGYGSYVNLSTRVKPFRSTGVISSYKLVKEDSFLSGILEGLLKE